MVTVVSSSLVMPMHLLALIKLAASTASTIVS